MVEWGDWIVRVNQTKIFIGLAARAAPNDARQLTLEAGLYKTMSGILAAVCVPGVTVHIPPWSVSHYVFLPSQK
jgi:hypothetical protein